LQVDVAIRSLFADYSSSREFLAMDMGKSDSFTHGVRMVRECRLNRGGSLVKRTAPGLLLLSILIAPSVASADIDFVVTNKSSKNVCVYCAGPWFRIGISEVLGFNFVQRFYTAETNIFSPFGDWSCGVKESTNPLLSECERVGLPPQKTNFCVSDVPGVAVNLTVNPDGTIISDKPPQPFNGCNDSGIFAFLGDSPAGQQYRGAYRFAGKANEVVTVTLDRDGARGSEGEIAQLTLRHDQGARLQTREGALPITFTVTLPNNGNYEVTVAYPSADTPKPFRGYYQLDVMAPNGEPVSLEPINP
jgi:hypothetical protein